MPKGDRAWFKWTEPSEFVRGARLVLEVVIPTDELTTPGTEPSSEEKARTILLDPAPSGEATIVSLVITEPGREVTGYPLADDRPTTGAVAQPRAVAGLARLGREILARTADGTPRSIASPELASPKTQRGLTWKSPPAQRRTPSKQRPDACFGRNRERGVRPCPEAT